jgi:hypothetical protein
MQELLHLLLLQNFRQMVAQMVAVDSLQQQLIKRHGVVVSQN